MIYNLIGMLVFVRIDYAYLKYGKFEELVLSTEPENEYISYEEIYGV